MIMARLKNRANGVIVNVSDEKAARLGSGWAPVGATASTPRSEKPDMTWKADELKAYAAEHDIDLGEATKKADIISAIENAGDENDD